MNPTATLSFVKCLLVTTVIVAPLAGQCGQRALPPDVSDMKQQVERGRYLVSIGGCNDCHTPGYAAAGGQVPLKLEVGHGALTVDGGRRPGAVLR